MEPLSNQPIAEPEDPLQRIASAQDCLVLDEELNHLPAKYREVLVMTYFSSQTSQQIADQLSVSKGTIDGRIREARNRLRIRLARRGVAVGTLAVAAGLSSGTSAMASTKLLESTIQLGAQTLSSSVPGTTDLSHLDPFIQAETAMITTKTILTSLFCATAVAGIIGMNGLSEAGDGAAVGGSGQPTAQVDAVVAERVDEVAAPAPLVDVAAGDAPKAIDEVQEETSLRIYYLQSLSVTSAVATFNKLFPDGPVMFKADARTNSMIVSANAEQHGQIQKMLGELGEGANSNVTKADGKKASDNSIATFMPYPRDVRPAEKWLYDMLEQPVDLDFPGETPLFEILRDIATKLTADHGETDGKQFLFAIFPDVKELELEGIESLDDIWVKDINFKNMALENALTFLFEQTTEPELTYEIRNEVMVVTTRQKAETSLVTRVYEVSHLVNLEFGQTIYPQAGFGGGGGGGMFSVQFGGGGFGDGGLGVPYKPGSKKEIQKALPREEEELMLMHVDKESLSSLVIEMTSPPCQWMEVDGDGGAIQQVGDTLVVRQTQEGHREIVRLLNLLTESSKKHTPAP